MQWPLMMKPMWLYSNSYLPANLTSKFDLREPLRMVDGLRGRYVGNRAGALDLDREKD